MILAVAGAGKTYHICNAINPGQRNLILAFTHENIHNIQNELCVAHGRIPKYTTIQTFHSFVYHHLILPYEASIATHFGQPNFVGRGISTIDPPKQNKTKDGFRYANPEYVKKDQIRHYITKNDQYYCSTLSELALTIKTGKESLIKKAANRLNLFYDNILIDEFQDFREHNYELIIKLSKHLKEIVLVGDYFQHSVSATNNTGKPFKKRKNFVSYDDFIEELKNLKFNIDTTSLDESRRCSHEICDFVSRKLGISINSSGMNQGSIFWVNEDQAQTIIENPEIKKLTYDEASKYTFDATNWSYSKGDTFDKACVILTNGLENLSEDDFSKETLQQITLNKLYVALTRSKGDLYLLKSSIFKKIKSKYAKTN